MRRILLSLLAILAVGAIATKATVAYFSDAETSTGNTFSAGSLDLKIDGGDTNVVKFTVANMRPGSQNIGTWKLKNAGTIAGFIDLENIAVTSYENGCLDPEVGDTTCGNPGKGDGELQNVVSLSKLFWDNDCDGWVDTGEATIYDGKVGAIASNYETNKAIAASAEVCLTGQFNWWSSANDNLAQGDGFDLDLTAELGQDASQ
jgi:predicted ribosomally synthesized peptide with SipW-like signal peptide